MAPFDIQQISSDLKSPCVHSFFDLQSSILQTHSSLFFIIFSHSGLWIWKSDREITQGKIEQMNVHNKNQKKKKKGTIGPI